MMETLEGICNISKNREVEFRVGVVPIQIQSKVAFALPITGDEIVLLEDSHEMFGMLFADVFCTKVVYTKSERDGTPIMFQKKRGEFVLSIALFVQPFSE